MEMVVFILLTYTGYGNRVKTVSETTPTYIYKGIQQNVEWPSVYKVMHKKMKISRLMLLRYGKQDSVGWKGVLEPMIALSRYF